MTSLQKQQEPDNLPALIEANQPIFTSKYFKNLSVELAQKSTQISKISIDKSPEYLEKCVIYIISEALKLVANDFKIEQIIYISRMFINEFWHWKIDDLVLCLKKGTLGKYDKLYGQLSFSTMIEWFNKYQRDKDDFYENKLMDDHFKYGKRDYTTEQSQSLLAYYKDKNILKS